LPRIPKNTPKRDFATPKPGQDPDEFAEKLLAKWVPQMPAGALEMVVSRIEKLHGNRIEVPPKFEGLYTPARYKIYYGGRGGGKSWSLARVLVKRAAMESLRILCTREFQSSIADSVYRLICDTIQSTGLSEFFEVTQSQITSTSGSLFLFKGLRRSIQEIKSLEGIDVCWVEEAQTISNNSWQILIPTIRKEGSEIWISFNPEQDTDPTYQRFVVNTPPNSIRQKVGWEDNPHLPATLDAERRYMLEVDPEAYDHVWGGECRQISDAVIFRGRFEIHDFDAPADGTRLYYGADWGFANDPTALVRCFIADDCLYVDQEAYGVGVELDDLPDMFRTVPGAEVWPICADSARPETISHMRRRGFNITGAPKWSGSVEDGLAVLKGFRRIYVHPRCKHAAEEFRLYSYKTDPLTNEVLPIIISKHDHIIDSLRYSLAGYIKHSSFFDGCDYE
jgi:phage terminase large subunit